MGEQHFHRPYTSQHGCRRCINQQQFVPSCMLGSGQNCPDPSLLPEQIFLHSAAVGVADRSAAFGSAEGSVAPVLVGLVVGCEVGAAAGCDVGWDEGGDLGFTTGFDVGCEDGLTTGFDVGCDAGPSA